jgi:GT2 family glycosyltransferase
VFSFIVPVKNGLDYTRAFVESVRRTNPSGKVEWVIVDSGSTDGTLDYAAALGARVVPFRGEPFNYCAAINAGAGAASGDLWIIANNDLEFRSTGDLERIERVFREWPLLTVLSPGRSTGEAELEFLHERINGATWVVRPEAFRSWGGMPEGLSGYGYDEVYTAVQCWRRGYGNGWLTGWEVFHHESITFGPLSGNVTPALRRNLRRLLGELNSGDLDRPVSPYVIMRQLTERELRRAPVHLDAAQGQGPDWARQGYANAKARLPSDPQPPARVVISEDGQSRPAAQWLPWLANELLLQPDAAVVGAHGCYAVRESAPAELAMAPQIAAQSVGPPPPPLMPALAEKRPTLVQRVAAALHDWRRRDVELPPEW